MSTIPEPSVDTETYAMANSFMRIANRAVHKAQEESRRLGVPNVYHINGLLYYEMPNGELSLKDPYPEKQ